MCIFQSEELIKLKMSWFHWKSNEWSPVQNPLDYNVGCNAGTLSEIHAKIVQHCRTDDCLAIDME